MNGDGERPVSNPAALSDQQLAENEARILRLADLVGGGHAITLVGAGSSVSAGYPTWSQLLKQLGDVAEKCLAGFTLRSGAEPLESAQAIRDWIVRERGREYFDAAFGRLFVRDPALTPFHDDLLRLPFRGYITTNYDTTLEEAAVSSGRVPSRPNAVPVWASDPRLVDRAVRALTNGNCLEHIIHLHGLCGSTPGEALPGTILLAADDYETAYGIVAPGRRREAAPGEPRRLRMVLSSLLLTRQIVFVGFSLDDPFITEVLLRSAELSWAWDHPVHFAIMPTWADTAALDQAKAERLRTDLAIESVFYQARGADHSERDALVRRIRHLVDGAGGGPVQKPPTPQPALPAHAPLPWVAAANRAHQIKHEEGK